MGEKSSRDIISSYLLPRDVLLKKEGATLIEISIGVAPCGIIEAMWVALVDAYPDVA